MQAEGHTAMSRGNCSEALMAYTAGRDVYLKSNNLKLKEVKQGTSHAVPVAWSEANRARAALSMFNAAPCIARSEKDAAVKIASIRVADEALEEAVRLVTPLSQPTGKWAWTWAAAVAADGPRETVRPHHHRMGRVLLPIHISTHS